MQMAVDSLSASAPTRGQRISQSLPRHGTPEQRNVALSPGGTFSSYGSTKSESATRNASLKQAKGTGRTIGEIPNRKSYNELRSEIENTPGAEIRM